MKLKAIQRIYKDNPIMAEEFSRVFYQKSKQILVKRQYEIEVGKLNSFQGVDTFSNDEIMSNIGYKFEIMEAANNITRFINLKVAQPVIRYGINVNYIKYDDGRSQIDTIIDRINQYKETGHKSIAIICKNDKKSNELNKKIKRKYNEIKNIVNSETEYTGGLCTITSSLAKGLEFDGVIISDASEEKYDSNRIIDMKLLYVSMTRPLHELNVLYKDKITRPLQKLI